jgi:hypothetical protein
LIHRLKDEFDLLARQQLELATVHQRFLVFRTVQSIRIWRVPSLAVPLSKPQDRRPVSRVMRSMLNEPALSLHPPGLKMLSVVFSWHQSPRNSSGIEPTMA